MKIFNKIKWILGILIIFGLIVATNLIDRANFIRVKDSAVTIYEDRLVAKDLILKLSNAIHTKELAIAKQNTAFFLDKNIKTNTEIDTYLIGFENTKLTKEEEAVFVQFKQHLLQLKKAETIYLNTSFTNEEAIQNGIHKLKEDLNNLSKIQLIEGERQMSISKKAIDKIDLFTSIEIYILIVLAIIVQGIILYTPKKENV
ncbi:MCP four helix bundle domain-containing protein [uncultured Polaribacter sp.]|uniref:MCP four helix bundle domain-containing protein n=1 Tax=uncultured Polaribacter sp. TaxID=174711 RepID=UPI00262C95ED|nr:MCP four helix bundle domain-containing protein [uncultured Polaribacter sp.]